MYKQEDKLIELKSWAEYYKQQAEKKLEEMCRKLIATCNEELKCYLSCYIGEPVGICSTAEAYQKLVEVRSENINRSNSVTLQREACKNVKRLNRVPQFSEWSLLLELGRKEELLKQIHNFLYNADNGNASRELLDSFYHGIMSMLYALLHKTEYPLTAYCLRRRW
jgi:two-component system response regulator YesN